MIKKVLLGLLTGTVIGGAIFFYMYGEDKHGASTYTASTSKGLNVGSKMEFTLLDQFEKAHTLNDETKKVIFVSSRDPGHEVRRFLRRQPSDFLTSRNAFFVADMTAKPTAIFNAVTIPELQKSPYASLIVHNPDVSKQFSDEKNIDKIVVISLKNKVITAVDRVQTREELKPLMN